MREHRSIRHHDAASRRFSPRVAASSGRGRLDWRVSRANGCQRGENRQDISWALPETTRPVPRRHRGPVRVQHRPGGVRGGADPLLRPLCAVQRRGGTLVPLQHRIRPHRGAGCSGHEDRHDAKETIVTITSFAATTRRAASMSRRGSLRALGGAALTGFLAAPVAAGAGNTGRKAQRRCRRQREQCRTVFADLCEGAPTCEAAFAPCCEHFSRCDAGKGITCVYQVD